MLLGLLLLSLLSLLSLIHNPHSSLHIFSSPFLFAALICLKHLFLYLAPTFGLLLLFSLLLPSLLSGGGMKRSLVERILKAVRSGLLVITLTFLPFLHHLPQLFSRLFPFERGLVHSYWAPNIWALACFVDRVLIKLVGVVDDPQSNSASSTSGLVGFSSFSILPTPSTTFISLLVLVFVGVIPFLWLLKAWNKLKRLKGKDERKNAIHHLLPPLYMDILLFSSLSSFMVGYHVHEKAILIPLFLSLPSLWVSSSSLLTSFQLTLVSTFSLFPLLPHFQETAPKLLIALSGFCLFRGVQQNVTVKGEGEKKEGWIDWMLVFVFTCHFTFFDIICPLAGWFQEAFLPLMINSVVCSLYLLYIWIKILGRIRYSLK